MSDPAKADDLNKFSLAGTGTGVIAILNLIPATIAFVLFSGYAFTLPCRYPYVMFWILLWVVVFGLLLLVAVLLFMGILQNKPNLLVAYVSFAVTLDFALVYNVLTKEKPPYAGDSTVSGDLWTLFKVFAVIIVWASVMHVILLCLVFRAWFAMRAKILNNEKTALMSGSQKSATAGAP